VEKQFVVSLDVFATNVAIRNDEEFTETLSALRLFRDHRCPFEIRIVRMIFYEIQVEQIAEVFSEINPTVCTFQYLGGFWVQTPLEMNPFMS